MLRVESCYRLEIEIVKPGTDVISRTLALLSRKAEEQSRVADGVAVRCMTIEIIAAATNQGDRTLTFRRRCWSDVINDRADGLWSVQNLSRPFYHFNAF